MAKGRNRQRRNQRRLHLLSCLILERKRQANPWLGAPIVQQGTCTAMRC